MRGRQTSKAPESPLRHAFSNFVISAEFTDFLKSTPFAGSIVVPPPAFRLPEQGGFTMTIAKLRAAAVLGASLFGTTTLCAAQQPTQTTVTSNDNTRSSGKLAG